MVLDSQDPMIIINAEAVVGTTTTCATTNTKSSNTTDVTVNNHPLILLQAHIKSLFIQISPHLILAKKSFFKPDRFKTYV